MMKTHVKINNIDILKNTDLKNNGDFQVACILIKMRYFTRLYWL